LPDPCEPHMNILDRTLTLKKIRESWVGCKEAVFLLFLFSFNVLLLPASRPYWENRLDSPHIYLSAWSRTRMVKTGDVVTSWGSCWSGFLRRLRWYVRNRASSASWWLWPKGLKDQLDLFCIAKRVLASGGGKRKWQERSVFLGVDLIV
jgi:hypothetical protein